MAKITKATELTDVSVQFVSLVDKAANQHTFVIRKAQEAGLDFAHCTDILKADTTVDNAGNEQHYVTGVVYEPMVEDSQGDYMTADEIAKAAYGFLKNGSGVDLQHNFQKLDSAAVVESWVTKADEDIEGHAIRKGTWLMTVETGDNDVWHNIQKGNITGFSIGGNAKRNLIDMPLDPVTKEDVPLTEKGFFAALRKFFGGTGGEPVRKAGRKMSGKNRAALQSLQDKIAGLSEELSAFASGFDDDGSKTETVNIADLLQDDRLYQDSVAAANHVVAKNEEEVDMTKEEMREVMSESLGTLAEQIGKSFDASITKAFKEGTAQEDGDTEKKESCQKSETPEQPLTKADVQAMLDEALDPIRKSAGLPTNLNNETDDVAKSDQTHSWANIFGA